MRTPSTLFACGLLVCVTSTAYAADLTGSYVGKWSCKGFDGAKFKIGNKAATLRITQTLTTIAVRLDTPMAPFGEFSYNGIVIDDAARPEKGEAALIECGSSDTVPPVSESEIHRATVKTKADGKGTFKSTSIYVDSQPEFGTCKYSFKRTTTADPGVTACP